MVIWFWEEDWFCWKVELEVGVGLGVWDLEADRTFEELTLVVWVVLKAKRVIRAIKTAIRGKKFLGIIFKVLFGLSIHL